MQPRVQELGPEFIQQKGNLFGQTPTPATDAAWDNLTTYGFVWVREHDLTELGKDPTISLKVPESYGLGDAYVAQTDFSHKIHCLDKLRREILFDHYFGPLFPDGKPSPLHQSHTEHCLEVLLQSLICEASTDIIPFTWYDNSENAFRDLSSRKCGNFDGVFQWAQEHVLPVFPNDIAKPKGQATVGSEREELLDLLTQIDDQPMEG